MMDDDALDGIAAIRHYIDRIVTGDGKCQGMKVLLLDAATTQIVSCVYSQTEILSNEVYLVARLDDQHHHAATAAIASSSSSPMTSSSSISKKQSHLKAVCFVRPTDISVGLLVRELAQPRFSEYHIFFSGMLTTGLLRLLAEQDLHEKVKQVQELYGDFVPINEDLLTMQCRNTLAMSVAAGTSWAPQHSHLYERNVKGLQGILLGLKRQPNAIRYAGHSACAEELAKDIHDAIVADDIFHFRKPRHSGGTLLLVLDRRDDPVTPLLSQWTYQAMVHELLGLNNHRVILRGAPNVPKDLEEVVLSASQDEFFRNNRHKNFGELGEEIQRLLKDYQKQTAQHNTSNLNTIEDMQAFMEKFPELKSRSHTVSKHVAIMGELARLVEICSLMDVSQFEQELACADDHTAHWRELMEKLESATIKIPDKLRLGLLYALRYEHSGNLHMVQQAMKKGGVPPDMVNLVNVMLRYGGSKSRGPGLYGEQNNLMTKMTKSFMTGVQGVSNVYSQHVPLLMDTVQSVIKGKLRRDTHPFVEGSYPTKNRNNQPPETIVPQEIIVFMVGGVTYEEGTKISEFNQLYKGKYQVILGGSTVHNSTSFLEELKATAL